MLELLLALAGILAAPAPPPAPLERPPVPTSELVVEEPAHVHAPEPVAVGWPWDALAECESHGQWDYGPHSGWGSGIYQGGLQMHPGTWDAYRDPTDPPEAYLASKAAQVRVAERVLAAQGWGAWPACSRKLGLR